ncbi:hypothetical protein GEV33_007990 [Tenebrio molitor]|uniref:Uncharacterized protein n=1 Tax=Tenebrio molitor TaxID=7067 RepID=A0A8J6HHD7_TENMO|nr:hypothetical protein GEV33_007990 [Tenebrio molitor]
MGREWSDSEAVVLKICSLSLSAAIMRWKSGKPAFAVESAQLNRLTDSALRYSSDPPNRINELNRFAHLYKRGSLGLEAARPMGAQLLKNAAAPAHAQALEAYACARTRNYIMKTADVFNASSLNSACALAWLS